MTLQQFNILGDLEKLSAILEHGRLMAQNTEDDSKVFLYRLETFYVTASYFSKNDELNKISGYLEVDQSIPHFRKHFISINPAEREYDTPQI